MSIKQGLVIKKDEICKMTITNYETKKDKIIEIKNGEIINNTERFKLTGHKIDDGGYFLENILDKSGKFLGETRNIILTSECYNYV